MLAALPLLIFLLDRGGWPAHPVLRGQGHVGGSWLRTPFSCWSGVCTDPRHLPENLAGFQCLTRVKWHFCTLGGRQGNF